MKNKDFISGVEKLINPITVGSLHFLQSYNQMLPVAAQKKIVEKSSKQNPYMGFVVEPYSMFSFQKINNLEYFKTLVAPNFELEKCSPFAGSEPDYYLITAAFNARTSAFFGSRVEAYVIATDNNTGLTSWIIIDYLSNTISYDNRYGLIGPSVSEGYITTDYHGNVSGNMDTGENGLRFKINIEGSELRNLDQKLWVEGNLSISYGTKYDDSGQTFALKFEPGEMLSGLDVKVIESFENELYSDYVDAIPEHIVVFKYAQHFISDSPGHYSEIASVSELKAEVNNIEFDKLKVYSTTDLTSKLLVVPIVLLVIIVLLLII